MFATGGVVLTNIGKKLLAEAFEKERGLIFTRIAVGTGDIINKEEALNLTNLKSPYLDMEMTTIVRKGDLIRLRGTLNNKEFTTEKIIKEVGIFAKISTGNEILFGYVNDGYGELIPSGSTGNYITRVRDLYVGVTGEVEASIEIDKSLVHPTIEDVEEWLEAKEPKIIKKSGFNLEKSDSINLKDTNKLATALALASLNDEVIKKATSSSLGRVKIGKNLTIKSDGTLEGKDPYSLPKATTSIIGGVKVGKNLTIKSDGTLEADEQRMDLTPIEDKLSQKLDKSGGTMSGSIRFEPDKGITGIQSRASAGIYPDMNNSINFSSGKEDIFFGWRQVGNNRVKKYNFGDSDPSMGLDGLRKGTLYADDYYYDNGTKSLKASIEDIFALKLDKTGGTVNGNIVVTDSIYCNGNITAFSDKRLKENIEKIDNALDKVMRLNGYTFNMIGSDKRMTGVIAQEVEKVLPEAIEYNENGYMSVAYGNIIGLLIEAIKSQAEDIEWLKAKCEV